MAENTQTAADTAEDKARKAKETADAAQAKAADADKSPEERKADEAAAKADDATAKAKAERDVAAGEGAAEATIAEDAKALSAVLDPDREVGDHHVQTFANIPENPQLAPGLDPNVDNKDKVRVELTDSDHPDPANPKVAYVHKEMVGDYQRAGWRLPVV